jgi:NADPH:quinone reductase-like Zn-dependent oxidoreductase
MGWVAISAGVVERGAGANSEDDHLLYRPGTRVCGTVFPYDAVDTNSLHHRMRSFAEYVVADSRLLLRVPDQWGDVQAAALGGVGWSTIGLAMSSSDSLALPGRPSKPTEERLAILVYGGGTATGTMAIQMLRLYILLRIPTLLFLAYHVGFFFLGLSDWLAKIPT